MFGAGFLGRARFFSSDAAAATQGGSKPPAPAEAGSAGGEGGGDGQSGKSEQADTGKAVRGGVSHGLHYQMLLDPPYSGTNRSDCSDMFIWHELVVI